MIENLLWPKLLNKSPWLLVDPAMMFDSLKSIYNSQYVPLVNACPIVGYPPTIRLNTVGVDEFTIGLIFDLNKRTPDGFKGFVPLMFQYLDSEITICRCLGWHTKTNSLISNPDKGYEVDVSKLDPRPVSMAFTSRRDFQNGRTENLFSLRSAAFEDDGNLPQFESAGTYSAINYVLTDEFLSSAINGPFRNMWDEFHTDNFTDGMLAIEIVVHIAVQAQLSPDGFRVGVYSE